MGMGDCETNFERKRRPNAGEMSKGLRYQAASLVHSVSFTTGTADAIRKLCTYIYT